MDNKVEYQTHRSRISSSAIVVIRQLRSPIAEFQYPVPLIHVGCLIEGQPGLLVMVDGDHSELTKANMAMLSALYMQFSGKYLHRYIAATIP